MEEDANFFLFIPDKAIDEYANLRTKAAQSSEEASKIDPRLEAIVERLLEKYDFFQLCYTCVPIS